MKKITTTIVFAYITCLFPSFQGGCLPEGIIFATRAQIDSFQVNDPECSGIEGDIEIIGNHITRPVGLNAVTSVAGNLWMAVADSLACLPGLQYHVAPGSLMTGHHFGYGANPSLTGIGDPQKSNKGALKSLAGPENITSLSDFLVISKAHTGAILH